MSARGRPRTATIANDDNGDQPTDVNDGGHGQMRDTHETAV
jgi:hypothetical protein